MSQRNHRKEIPPAGGRPVICTPREVKKVVRQLKEEAELVLRSDGCHGTRYRVIQDIEPRGRRKAKRVLNWYVPAAELPRMKCPLPRLDAFGGVIVWEDAIA